MKNPFPFTTGSSWGAKPITFDQFRAIMMAADQTVPVVDGQLGPKIETRSPLSIPVRCVALATYRDFNATGPERDQLVVYGFRTLTKIRKFGTALEGWVSVCGKSRRGFMSDAVFQLPNGKLARCATIHVCKLEVEA